MKPEFAPSSRHIGAFPLGSRATNASIDHDARSQGALVRCGKSVLDRSRFNRLEADVVIYDDMRVLAEHRARWFNPSAGRPARLLVADVDMANASIPADGSVSPDDPSKRDFLYIATAAIGAVGAGGIVWPLVSQMEPDAQTIAEGAPVDVDVSAIAPGQQILVKWRGHPIFIVNRPEAALKTLQDPELVNRLSDPESKVAQQPDYAENWHRSVKPELLVLVGVCTHLGCIPGYRPDKGDVDASWLGGYFCPCHGSKYDLSGRVYSGVPAPYNLPVPPYIFVNDKTIRVGANPAGGSFDLSKVVAL